MSAEQLSYFVFIEQTIPTFPESYPLQDNIKCLQLNSSIYSNTSIILKDNQGISLGNFANYGTVSGLYWIWKNTDCPYVGFSLSMNLLSPSEEDIHNLLTLNRDILVSAPQPSVPLQENYRNHYYSYDFSMMLSILKKCYPKYYAFTKEHVLTDYSFIEPACIMRRDTFNKFCAWLFPILELCHTHLCDKLSSYQNRYLEHLTYYLFIIYIKYNSKKIRIEYTKSCHTLTYAQSDKETLDTTNLLTDTQLLLNKGALEKAYGLVLQHPQDENHKNLLALFKNYERERHYYKETTFDKSHDLCKLMESLSNTPHVIQHRKKVLIFEWASVSHRESILAFQALGFECHTYKLPFTSWIYDEDFLEQFNRHLDYNSFDMVFSLNYFAMIAEACYVHELPYVAWCYDSPTFIGNINYLKYPTNHVFMFDSNEAKLYQSNGCNNVHYMPLAVNVDRYDKIRCAPDEITKYSSSISFVGSLYTTNLTTALNHLSDYQKAYINAMIDNQLFFNDYSFFPNILSSEFMDWISHPDFNRTINAEWDKDKATSSVPPAQRLQLLMNKIVTNRERLLLISMLSNHWNFKLYSNTSHEVFKNTIQCGTVDYYQDMPKVFKNSLINLNITFKSIEAGIPLRCLDIMGCHGLLLTNHQKDFDEHFKDHKNLLFYNSIEEAYDKVNFYLSHETERKIIENNGYETVKKYYNYPNVLKEILIISGLKHLVK